MKSVSLAVLGAFLGLAVAPEPALAKPTKQHRKKPRTVVEEDWAQAPSAKYAALGKSDCLRELRRRNISFDEVTEAPGVLAPVRLDGPLGGVSYHTEETPSARAKSPHEIFDCRLVLGLDDFSTILRAHDVEEALIFSAWRPPAKGWPAGRLGTRHPGALAVDIRVLQKKAVPGAERPTLVVLRDWQAARDKPACGDQAPPILPNTSEAKDIRAIYCEAAAGRIFSTMLGPNFNHAHENHFHLEITPGVKWRLLL